METVNSSKQTNNQNPNNESPVKQWAPLAILLVAAAIVGWQLGQPKDKTDSATKTQTEQSSSETPAKTEISSPSSTGTDSAGSVGNMRFEGMLSPSTDVSRGNVVVKSGNSEIYLWTSRSIQDLVGKTVTVEAEGNMQGFRVLDIKVSEIK